MPDVKFTIEADPHSFLAASEKIKAEQKAQEQGHGRIAASAESASKRTVAALNKEQAAYNVNAEGVTGSGVTTRPASGRRGRISQYGVDDLASTRGQSLAGMRAEDRRGRTIAGTNRDLRTEDETFQRFLKSQTIRKGRQDDRAFEGFIQQRDARMALDRVNFAATKNMRGTVDSAMGDIRGDAQERLDAADTIAKNNFQGKIDKKNQTKEKWAETRQNLAQGALVVGGAVTAFANYQMEELNRYGYSLTVFEDTMGGLYTVGKNSGKRKQIRDQVLALSGGSGVDVAQVAGLRYSLESAYADASPDVLNNLQTEALKFQKFQPGGDLQATGRSLGKYVAIFGDDLEKGGAGVRQAASRLARAADKGDFELGEVTPYIGDVMTSFKAMGYKDTDVLAAMSVASPILGKPETMMTAFRNMALLLPKMKEKLGVERTGDFAADMGLVASHSSEEQLAMFGERTFVAAKAIADRKDAFLKERQVQEGITSKQDIVGDKLAVGYTDPVHVTSEIIKSAKQGQKNAPITQLEDAGLRQQIQDLEVRKRGADDTTDPLLSYFKAPAAWAEQASQRWIKPYFAAMTSGASDWAGDHAYRKYGNGLLKAGAARGYSDAIAAKDMNLAAQYKLQYGKELDTYTLDSSGAKVFTGTKEAAEYAKLRGGDFKDLSDSEYLQYKQLQATGTSKAAEKYLHDAGLASADIDSKGSFLSNYTKFMEDDKSKGFIDASEMKQLDAFASANGVNTSERVRAMEDYLKNKNAPKVEEKKPDEPQTPLDVPAQNLDKAAAALLEVARLMKPGGTAESAGTASPDPGE